MVFVCLHALACNTAAGAERMETLAGGWLDVVWTPYCNNFCDWWCMDLLCSILNPTNIVYKTVPCGLQSWGEYYWNTFFTLEYFGGPCNNMLESNKLFNESGVVLEFSSCMELLFILLFLLTAHGVESVYPAPNCTLSFTLKNKFLWSVKEAER